MGKVIVIVSGKGGTGKTTAAGSIGSCLGAMGKRTLCVDCDAGLRNLDITLGMTNYAAANLNHVVDGSSSLGDACVRHPQIENLFFLDAPPQYQDDFDADGLRKVFAEIRESYDFCLLDAPAGIGPDVETVVAMADMAIIVATGDASSMRDGQVVAAKIRDSGVTDIRLLVNRVRSSLFDAASVTVDNMIDAIGAQLIGIVREDKEVIISANLETPLVLFSRKTAAKDFLKIARRLCGEDIPISIR